MQVCAKERLLARLIKSAKLKLTTLLKLKILLVTITPTKTMANKSKVPAGAIPKGANFVLGGLAG